MREYWYSTSIMPRRFPSPTPSINEYDLSTSLFNIDGNGGDDNDFRHEESQKVDAPQHGNLDLLGAGSDDDEAIIAASQAASNRKTSNIKGRSVKKGGGFQAMGLNANLLKAITRKGFSVPTPIQRKTIPLLLQDKDVVGMARTGSGKTAAFVIPLIEKLKTHSTKVGARVLVMSPSRELALQTLQVVKELGRGTDLKCVLLVGGDSLEEQFASMTGNPDIVIATPGRFLHLKVEMGLDLSSMRYVVFDEADRLFEMGFAAQLTEILHALPASRQTLLFSATLPKSLVEFARAGLQDPVLVRLDAESKISPDLQSCFFTVKSSEREGALLHILQNIIQLPSKSEICSDGGADSKSTGSKKRKRGGESSDGNPRGPSPHSTIVFAATKHHVEYLAQLLRLAGYSVSYVYGSLDQTARKIEVQKFRTGSSNILVVTDVAARGIDIPVLANVINYDFPSQAKVFVHRVGRTARAGQKGWSYSLITDADAPYLLDLQLFLGRKLILGRQAKDTISFSEDVVVGGLSRDQLANTCEWVTKNLDDDDDLSALRSVAMKGEKQYLRTRNSASSESAKRAKNISSTDPWNELHPLFNDENDDVEAQREKMLAIVGGFRPQESIFEIGARRGGKKGNDEAMDTIKKVRKTLNQKRQKSQAKIQQQKDAEMEDQDSETDGDDTQIDGEPDDMSMASDSELEVTFSQPQSTREKKVKHLKDPNAFRDSENFMSYRPANTNLEEDRAYGVHSGSNSNFTQAARSAQMDIALDEASKTFGENRGVMRWDKRHKKYVARQNDDDGSKGTRLVRGESGAKIAASFRSGRFDAWKKAHKVRLPKVGETESANTGGGSMGKRYRHNKTSAPKAADKYRGDYEKRVKKVKDAQERNVGVAGKNELRSVDDIRKQRKLQEKRREKNARPSKKGKQR